MVVFKKDLHLEKLEKTGNWIEARNLVYNTWQMNKHDLSNLLRVGTECWYVLTFWERINVENCRREDFSRPLTETKIYGENNYGDNVDYLWIYGYMISLFPYLFEDFQGDIDLGAKNGEEMILKALDINPQNPILALLASNEINNKKKNYEVKCLLKEMFQGSTEIEKYFQRVLVL